MVPGAFLLWGGLCFILIVVGEQVGIVIGSGNDIYAFRQFLSRCCGAYYAGD